MHYLSFYKYFHQGLRLLIFQFQIFPPLLSDMVMSVAEPPVVSREPNNSKVEEGGEVELECEVRGTPTPKVMWLLNGEPLDNDTHANIRGLPSLPDLF